MKRTIAIGDIHGCASTLLALIHKLELTLDDEIYFLGDYIDRGPNTKGVIHTILALQQMGYHIHTLRGNHEELMMDSELGFFNFNTWIQNGGEQTLDNIGVDFFNEMPKAYQDFFENTKLYIENDKYIFVHAGLNFELEDIYSDKEAMLWVRGFEPLQPKLKDKILIHGHTPTPLVHILSQKGNCYNIDGGCVYHYKPGYGYLVALVLETMQYVYVPYCG